jgi:hypothetical protein
MVAAQVETSATAGGNGDQTTRKTARRSDRPVTDFDFRPPKRYSEAIDSVASIGRAPKRYLRGTLLKDPLAGGSFAF